MLKQGTQKRVRLLGRHGHEEPPHKRYKIVTFLNADIDVKEFFHGTAFRGQRTPENKRWSLHSSEFYYARLFPGMAAMVGRSMLLAMNGEPDDIPPIDDPLDLHECKDLPEWPIDKDKLHYMYRHHYGNCYWPRMKTLNTTHKLDRAVPMFERLQIDILLVHDPDNVTYLRNSSDELFWKNRPTPSLSQAVSDEAVPIREFIKFLPVDAKRLGVPWVPLPPKDPPIIAHLFLDNGKQLGTGNSAVVFNASLMLPEPITTWLFKYCYSDMPMMFDNTDRQPRMSEIPNRFLVAAKIPKHTSKAHGYINNEAKTYASFPSYLSEDWSGYQVIGPVQVPQQACAVVPKSFGYFAPEVTYFKLSDGSSMKPGEKLATPILLSEQCGIPLRPQDCNRYLK